MSVMVEFRGERYWYLGESLTDLDHAIAPLEDCDAFGRVKTLGLSFAHVFHDGSIRRFGQLIGHVRDLNEVSPRRNPSSARNGGKQN